MTTRSKSTLRAMAMATALGLLLCAGAQSAQAGEERGRNRAGHTPPRERTVHVERQRTDNGHTSQRVVTGADGRTATRDAVVTRDPQNRTRTRDVTYTGPRGGERTVNDVTQRTDTGYTRSTTATGPNGNSGTREVTVSCDKAAGNCSKDITVTRNPVEGN